MKLESWEVICDECNGDSFITEKNNENYSEVCPKCIGSGKLDFIENIVGKKDIIWKPRSIGASKLSQLNVRRLITYIEKVVRKDIDEQLCYNDKDALFYKVDNFLDILKNRKAFKWYDIEITPLKNRSNLDITIRPQLQDEAFKISFTYTTQEQYYI
jgi:hypothetical protein